MIVPPWCTMPRTDSRDSCDEAAVRVLLRVQQAVEPVADADDVPAAVAGRERRRPDDGVQARARRRRRC